MDELHFIWLMVTMVVVEPGPCAWFYMCVGTGRGGGGGEDEPLKLKDEPLKLKDEPHYVGSP